MRPRLPALLGTLLLSACFTPTAAPPKDTAPEDTLDTGDTGTPAVDVDTAGTDTAGGDTAGGDTPGDDAPACASAFTITYPDGSGSSFDGCARWELEPAYDFDPDAPPTLSAGTLFFNAWPDGAFTCGVTLHVAPACEPGTYPISASTTASWATADCSGTADLNEGAYDADLGWIELSDIDNGTRTGNLAGDTVRTRLRGNVFARSPDGTTLEGTFDVRADATGEDLEVTQACEVMDGDADGDGDVSDALGGPDCDDADPAVSASDADGDGFSACNGDCDDSDASRSPGAGCAYVSVTGTLTVNGNPLSGPWTLVDPIAAVCADCDTTFILPGQFTFIVALAQAPNVVHVGVSYELAQLVGSGAATLTRGGTYDTLTFTTEMDWIGPATGDFQLHTR